MSSLPHIRQTGTTKQLIVDGQPFLMLGGELQNSQFSSARYMKGVWQRLKDAHLNTVLGSVSWEQIEAEEGRFCFDELDEIVLDARAHGLRLVLLWFGSFKNGLSTYAPAWVKRDHKRFPRAELHSRSHGRRVGDLVSIFHNNAKEADAKAFATLMRHLKLIDEGHNTVLMVQVENEVGLLGDSRDRCSFAEVAWQDPVPTKLLSWLSKDWSRLNHNLRRTLDRLRRLDTTSVKRWEEIPGDKDLIEEIFMAYHYAEYVEHVSAAGRAQYGLPLYTNVWQNYASENRDENVSNVVAGGDRPGDYPCGGGVTNVLDIWIEFAPTLDFIAPDVYLNDYPSSCASYRHKSQALFIPEQRRDEYGARRIWSAYGSYQCMGTAPFGIDTLSLEHNPFRKHYGLLSKMARHIVEAQTMPNACFGFFFDELRDDGSDPNPLQQSAFMDGWNVVVERAFVFGRPSAGCGMVIAKGDNEFLLLGWGFHVRFESSTPKACFTGILKFEEKEVTSSGELRTLRLLNGDETRSGSLAIMPADDPDYGGFPISVTIPANTGIALCRPYALLEDGTDV